MFVMLTLVAVLGAAPQQAPPTAPKTPEPVQAPYEFTSDIGAFFMVVKADKASAFEGALAKLRQALTQPSASAARKQQAAGWRVMKSTEKPTDGAITYLFLIDPVVKKANYDPIEIMRESVPNDVQAVFDQLSESIVSATRIGLKELMRMGGS